MKKVLAVAVVLLLAASAQAALTAVDAIGINFDTSIGSTPWQEAYTNTTTGAVDRSLVAGSADNTHANWANYNDFTTTMEQVPMTAVNGVEIPAMTVSMVIGYNGGGYRYYESMTSTNSLSDCSISAGDGGGMDNGLAWTNVPFASYKVFALMPRDGGWVERGTFNAPAGNDGTSNGRFYQAVQFVSLDAAAIPGTNVPEPATVSMLVLGGIATLIRRRNRR